MKTFEGNPPAGSTPPTTPCNQLLSPLTTQKLGQHCCSLTFDIALQPSRARQLLLSTDVHHAKEALELAGDSRKNTLALIGWGLSRALCTCYSAPASCFCLLLALHVTHLPRRNEAARPDTDCVRRGRSGDALMTQQTRQVTGPITSA